MTIQTTLRLLLFLGALLITCSGCLQSEDHLRLNADGSGRWSYRVTLGPQMTAMMASGDMEGGPDTLTAAGVKAAAKQTKGVTLKICDEKRNGTSQTLTVDLTFDSIAELASGPFAEQLGWEFKSEDGQLVACSAEPFGDEDDDDNVTMNISGMKPLLIGFHTARMLTLPNPVLTTNGKKRETHAAVWSVSVDANMSEADLKKVGDMRPRVACAMTGVTMQLPVELVIPEDEKEEETFGDILLDACKKIGVECHLQYWEKDRPPTRSQPTAVPRQTTDSAQAHRRLQGTFVVVRYKQ